MKKQSSASWLILFLLGAGVAAWLGYLAAPGLDAGLVGVIAALQDGFSRPFAPRFCSATGRAILSFLLVWLIIWLYLYASYRPTRYGEEHGTASWANLRQVCWALRNRKQGRCVQKADAQSYRLLTQNVRMGCDVHSHQRNLNVLLIGGAGSGKSTRYAMPNLMQCNGSYVVTDPKGELLAGCGKLLEENGIAILVLDLLDSERSAHYNPFAYLRGEEDVQKMVTFLFQATTPKGSAQAQDPFWNETAEMLLMAFCFYLYFEAPEDERSFGMVMELLRGCAGEGDEAQRTDSVTDTLFANLERRNPNHIAVRYYSHYKAAPQKTRDSIRIVLASHLSKFELPAIIELTSRDDLHLPEIGEKKTALFCRISDTDTSLNFLVSLLYLQLFDQLADCADRMHGGRLPVHVHFLMDEFANIALPDDFEKRVATFRGRNVSFSIILQNLTQLKALYKDCWESIVGNCDSVLYLGGNEASTHKYFSEQIGNQTIWQSSDSRSRGRNGNYNHSSQTTGRALMQPNEVRMLDNRKAILLIRGFAPVLDDKYDLTRHPNYRLTAMGGAERYQYDPAARITAADSKQQPKKEQAAQAPALPESRFVFLTETELEQQLLKKPSFPA